MVDISTAGTVGTMSGPKKWSALETSRGELSEEVSFGIGTLLIVEQSGLENRPDGGVILTTVVCGWCTVARFVLSLLIKRGGVVAVGASQSVVWSVFLSYCSSSTPIFETVEERSHSGKPSLLLSTSHVDAPLQLPTYFSTHFFFYVSLLFSGFWRSCGLRYRPFSPPVRAFSFLSRNWVHHAHCPSFLIECI